LCREKKSKLNLAEEVSSPPENEMHADAKEALDLLAKIRLSGGKEVIQSFDRDDKRGWEKRGEKDFTSSCSS